MYDIWEAAYRAYWRRGVVGGWWSRRRCQLLIDQISSQGYTQINFSSKSYISTASVATIYDSVALSISLPVCLTSCRWPVFCGHLIPTLLYNCTNQLKFVNWVCLSFIQWISCWSKSKYYRVWGKHCKKLLKLFTWKRKYFPHWKIKAFIYKYDQNHYKGFF